MKVSELFAGEDFVSRHVGMSPQEQQLVLASLGFSDWESFISAVIPSSVRFQAELELPEGKTESEALAAAKALVAKNQLFRSYIGQGYYPTVMPSVILRNVLENPEWYTPYTPYQAEVSQGRLEALLTFQQVCIDLTGMAMANASLLDEATAAAEAMAMARRISKSPSKRFLVDRRIYPQTLDVLKTRAKYFEFELVTADVMEPIQGEFFGAILQYTGLEGDVLELEMVLKHLSQKGIVTAVAADIMSLVLLKSPGMLGADIVLGSSQRFGVPMSFGGPHAAFFAFKEEYRRMAPGRLIGVSVDQEGKLAFRMALQTREQHIRREKATSNICTAQALLAILAGFYAVYHGPVRLKKIAQRLHLMASSFARAISKNPLITVKHQVFFDTVCVEYEGDVEALMQSARSHRINLGRLNEKTLIVAFSECSSEEEWRTLVELFTGEKIALLEELKGTLPESYLRRDSILTHPVFHAYHTEHEMLRYLKRLAGRDISLTRSMISLGSCTMKLNSATEMLPLTWEGLTNIHPFAPAEQVAGYLTLIEELEHKLRAITGFDAISVQPNSGAQGEYAGLVVIRRYLEALGQAHRKVCLIPKSAHGTNPASAQMAGLKVVVVACDEAGNVDIDDLESKVRQHADELAALMITYPSTHGVFEDSIEKICQLVHKYGGQVYMDGANLNAQVGLIRPADIGADVLHMNLHKTFCIPHGGGGPGVGPIGVKEHLKPYLPSHSIIPVNKLQPEMGAVAAAPYGSAGVLIITWMYLTLMGREGLLAATKQALLSANYLAHELKGDFPILYTGKNGWVAHECIVDLRPFKQTVGISEVDFAKRLIDFGFHAPTMSFPVAGTFMIEPTESESKAELDRFILAMKQMKEEVKKIQAGLWSLGDNPLVHAPHTASSLMKEWTHPYSKEEAFYPLEFIKENKYWPSVGRVNDVYGDKQLRCTLPLPERSKDVQEQAS
ncbi:MAG: aminomethyl-transferring glycine dehydrogenase [Neisseriaceae bacterium]